MFPLIEKLSSELMLVAMHLLNVLLWNSPLFGTECF